MRLPLMKVLGVSTPAAAVTNIPNSALTAVTDIYRHLRDGWLRIVLELAVGLPAFLGGFVGGFYGGLAPANALTAVAGGIILWQPVGVGVVGPAQDAFGGPLTSIGLPAGPGLRQLHSGASDHGRRYRGRARPVGGHHRAVAGFHPPAANDPGIAG